MVLDACTWSTRIFEMLIAVVIPVALLSRSEVETECTDWIVEFKLLSVGDRVDIVPITPDVFALRLVETIKS